MKGKKLGRLAQFWRAIMANVTPAELDWVREQLPERAWPLFLGMHLADQRHVLNVARTALKLAEGEPAADKALLVRCALLHDAGRRQGMLDIWGKVWTVLAEHYLSAGLRRSLRRRQVRSVLDRPGYALYVYEEHPRMGAAMLRELGMADEAEIIARHHEPPVEDEPIELTLLRRADEMN